MSHLLFLVTTLISFNLYGDVFIPEDILVKSVRNIVESELNIIPSEGSSATRSMSNSMIESSYSRSYNSLDGKKLQEESFIINKDELSDKKRAAMELQRHYTGWETHGELKMDVKEGNKSFTLTCKVQKAMSEIEMLGDAQYDYKVGLEDCTLVNGKDVRYVNLGHIKWSQEEKYNL